ncbi:unnamed protein product [Arabis nemorensis]|uniref:MATH domain-containing protein n=1 Tax=Arabis nemorensis TaxID=586526 RepID=A0A565BXM9_9BRAS|nr:unnamed protein product [Arabis nemorensis]
MGNQVDNKFTWVINNFYSFQSEKIYSDPFVIGGCRWRLVAFPKGFYKDNNLSLYLEVTDFESLPSGWRRNVEFSITIVNQFMESYSRVKGKQVWFHEKEPDLGFTFTFPLGRLHAKKAGFLMNDQIKIVAEVDVLDVIGKLDVPEEAEEAIQPLENLKLNDDNIAVSSDLLKETPTSWVDVNGFQVLSSQVDFARRVFEKHPEIALEIRTKNKDLRTSYMNLLLSVIKMLVKWPQYPSTDDLYDAEAALAYMKIVGFKFDWLEKKLDQVKEKKKKCARGA